MDWNRQFQTQQYADQRADVAYNREFNERQYADQRADTAWNQAFQNQQYTDQRADVAYNREFNERQYADQRADVAYNREFAERQFEAQQEQWRQQFDYNRMSDEQKINYNWITYSLQNGNDVSDDMLEKAGLSRDDYNRMKQQAQAATSGSYRPGTTPAWKQAGFESEDEYNKARAAGFSDPVKYRQSLTSQTSAYQNLLSQLGSNPSNNTNANPATRLSSNLTAKGNPATAGSNKSSAQTVSLKGPVSQKFVDALNTKAKEDKRNIVFESDLKKKTQSKSGFSLAN